MSKAATPASSTTPGVTAGMGEPGRVEGRHFGAAESHRRVGGRSFAMIETLGEAGPGVPHLVGTA
jgi:hypothetical protein